ncbi:MAG: inositol monophosphatase family protein [Polyangiaceae bacterium]|nr:inositol monophosphatase family protein [Polyangiaceae bacterium]
MTYRLPEEWNASGFRRRMEVAVASVTSCGAALQELRGFGVMASDDGTQLKTNVDIAAEGWVLGLLEGSFPDDQFLSEERFDGGNSKPLDTTRPFWTVDALDGTRSYVEGFDGYCVQVAYIESGVVQLGAIAEPAASRCYVGIRGEGSYLIDAEDRSERLHLDPSVAWPERPKFVDSTHPKGPAGVLFERLNAELLECGSAGLKICRIADGSGNVYFKEFKLKLWDIAPGEVILSEAGGKLSNWLGEPFPYTGRATHFERVAALPNAHLTRVLPFTFEA